MSPDTRPQLLALKAPPPGNYDTWTEEQRFNAEHHCYCFAQEYIIDHNATDASLRLGFPVKEAHLVGLAYVQHWLVKHYVKQIEAKMIEEQVVTKSALAALMWRDASNFDPKANPIARGMAQKNLAVLMEFNPVKKVEQTNKTAGGGGVPGGIMYVPHTMSIDDWEAEALAKQERLKAEVKQ